MIMKRMYNDEYETLEYETLEYETLDNNMSDSNIGARKNKNIRNHIFIINGNSK